jgi:hypothetical protein
MGESANGLSDRSRWRRVRLKRRVGSGQADGLWSQPALALAVVQQVFKLVLCFSATESLRTETQLGSASELNRKSDHYSNLICFNTLTHEVAIAAGRVLVC